jgi:hypothetical protein
MNYDAGRCINENKRGTHGPPVPGHVRCRACIDVHERTADHYKKKTNGESASP